MQMTPMIEKMFVNRSKEVSSFCRMLDNDSQKRIMAVKADGGMGKSWLLARFQYECKCRHFNYVEIDFKDTLLQDYLAILRHTRGQLSAKYYNSFTELVTRYTDRKPIVFQVGGGGQPESSQVHVGEVDKSNIQVAGGDLNIIQDNYFGLPADADAIKLREIQGRITSEFITCLVNQLAEDKKPTVWMFDHYEHASQDTQSWLYDRFLVKICNLEIRDFIIVIAGRNIPKFDLSWKHILTSIELHEMDLISVREYVKKLGMELSEETIDLLYKAFKGNPQEFALFLDGQVPEKEGK
jgi:hypothetical protein